MGLEDRIERLEKIVEMQTEILDTIVKTLVNDNRIDNIIKAFECQKDINNTLYDIAKS